MGSGPGGPCWGGPGGRAGAGCSKVFSIPFSVLGAAQHRGTPHKPRGGPQSGWRAVLERAGWSSSPGGPVGSAPVSPVECVWQAGTSRPPGPGTAHGDGTGIVSPLSDNNCHPPCPTHLARPLCEGRWMFSPHTRPTSWVAWREERTSGRVGAGARVRQAVKLSRRALCLPETKNR